MIFWDRKSQNWFFFNFFITKTYYFISNIDDDFYEHSFEVYNISLGQKLTILEFSPKIFSFWPRSLLKPPEAKLWASVTSLRSQILAEDVSFHMRYCMLDWDENWSIQRPLSLSGSFWPPPRLLNWPKSPHWLGLISKIMVKLLHILVIQSLNKIA